MSYHEVEGGYKVSKNHVIYHYIDRSFKCYNNRIGNISTPEKEHHLYTIEIYNGEFADVPENNGYKKWLYASVRIFKDSHDLKDLLSKNGWKVTYKTVKNDHFNMFNCIEFVLTSPTGQATTWSHKNDPEKITDIIKEIHTIIGNYSDTADASIVDLQNEIASLKKRNSELEMTISSIKKLVSQRKSRKS